ncbi:MAG TPA: ribosome recycling factor [Planctomycetota bacterium]|nr:ribosome recycling factor [Planctomycetota bacterium]
MSADPVIKETNDKMDKTLATFHDELRGVRSGRATPDLLNNIRVEYYGSMTPLQQLGSTSILDARTLVVTPYDATIVKDIEKAIMKSELGVTPHVDNKIVRVSIPALTEERRKELVKYTKTRSEGAKTALRNVRRDAIKAIETLCKDKKISEDQRDKAKTGIQKTIEAHEKKIDTEVNAKVAEIMQV